MTVSRTLLQTVESLVKANVPTGLKETEVSILPEGKVPASMGEKWLTIHPITLSSLDNQRSTRRRRSVTFGLSLSQRMRKDPNDRFDDAAYMDTTSMSEILESYIPVIESNSAFNALKTAFEAVIILPENVNPPYDPSDPDNIPTGLPPLYDITGSFLFLDLNLDPIHLYPSDFLTRAKDDKQQVYDKIAGYKMTLRFESPYFSPNYNPLECKTPLVQS